MSERFFSPQPIQTELVLLSGPEAHHLLHVMRAKPGDRLMLFDGSGWEFEAELLQASRHQAQLRIRQRLYVDRELPVLLVLAVAMPKGDRQKWLVEKAVELGVGRLVPLAASRAVAQPGPAMLDRLRRTVIEASKQCGRNLLMQIQAPMSWPEWLSAFQTAQVRWVADPAGSLPCPPTCHCLDGGPAEGGRGTAPDLTASNLPESAKPIWAVAVGPEGGWTQQELSQAQSVGWQLISLGPRILRTETAALSLAALLATCASTRLAPVPCTQPSV